MAVGDGLQTTVTTEVGERVDGCSGYNVISPDVNAVTVEHIQLVVIRVGHFVQAVRCQQR